MGEFIKKTKEIFQGWKNHITDNDEVKDLASHRMNICNGCFVKVDNTCSKLVSESAVKTFKYNGELRIEGQIYPGCGCPLVAKTKSPDSLCPLGKW